MGNKQEKINKEQDMANIVSRTIGEKIEKAFASDFDRLNQDGTPFTLQ